MTTLSAGKNVFVFEGTQSIPLSTFDEYLYFVFEKPLEDLDIRWMPGKWRNYTPGFENCRTTHFKPGYLYRVNVKTDFNI